MMYCVLFIRVQRSIYYIKGFNGITVMPSLVMGLFKVKIDVLRRCVLTLSEVNPLHPRVDLRRILAGTLFASGRSGSVAASATVTATAATVGRRGRNGRGGRRGRLRDGPLGGWRRTGHRASGRPDRLHDGGWRRPGTGWRCRGRGQVLRGADAVRCGRRGAGYLVFALDTAGRGWHADNVVVKRGRYRRYSTATAGGREPDAAAMVLLLQVLQMRAGDGCGGGGRLKPLVLLLVLLVLLVVDRVQLCVVDHGRRRLLLHVLRRRVLLGRIATGGRTCVVHAATAAAAALGGLSVIVGRGSTTAVTSGTAAAGAVAGLQRVYGGRDGPALLLLLRIAVHELIRTHIHLNGSDRARALNAPLTGFSFEIFFITRRYLLRARFMGMAVWRCRPRYTFWLLALCYCR